MTQTDSMKEKKTKSRSPLILSVILLLLVFGFSLFFIIQNKQSSDAGSDTRIACIYQNGDTQNPVMTIDLNEVEESYSFRMEGDDGAFNTIEVHPGEIGIVDASCPDHICIDTGFVSGSNLPIVCLPNKLVIEVKTEGSDSVKTDGDESITYDGVAK